MKNYFKIPLGKLSLPVTRRKPSNSRVVFVHWDRETIDYLITTPGTQVLSSHDIGSVPRADHANPFKALAEHFQQQQIVVGRLVALLSRPELDQLQLELPPADQRELPALVTSGVEEQLGEAEEPPSIDYLAPPEASSAEVNEGSRILAFALSSHERRNLESQCESAGFRLAAIASRHLSPLGVLTRRALARNALTVSVHVYSAEVELVICRHNSPLLLRSIRFKPDEPARVAEQISLETQRCLTLLPEESSAEAIAWCIFTTSDFAWQISRALEDRGLAVQTIDPLFGWSLTSRIDDSAATEPSTAEPPGSSAANAGAAWEFTHGGLPVDLLAPKRAPTPPNPYVRWGSIGAAAVLVLTIGVGFLLADVRALETQAADLQLQLEEAKKISTKYQSKADQVAYVEGWLADQVDWLAELEQLSQRLPQGQNATVRRLNAGTVDRTAVFDLSVQVAQQEHISQLEHGIRSAKYATSSKSINQKADESEYPWQFETRITFAIDPPDSKNYSALGEAPPFGSTAEVKAEAGTKAVATAAAHINQASTGDQQ
jgi:hypothetical protein